MSRKKRRKSKEVEAVPVRSFSDKRFALLLFAGALLVRLICLVEISGTPMADTAIGDGESYDLWAREIAAGNWLGDEIFYAAPLYPYFMGVIYAVVGPSLLAVRIVQVLLGAGACLLMWRGTVGFFDERTGRLAGIIAALYAPAIYFDVLIQKASLGFFLFTLLFFLLARQRTKPQWQTILAMGLVLGLMGITRENALILLPVLLVWLTVEARAWSVRAARIGLMVAGMLVVILPITIRNQVVAGEWVVTTSNLGTNLWIGNNPEADGRYAPLRPGRGDWKYERVDATALAEAETGETMSPSQVSAFWRDRTLGHIADEPLDWLALMVRKAMMVINRTEIADTEDIYTYSGWSLVLGLLLWVANFGVLFPLAVLGIARMRARWRELWLLVVIAAAYAGSVVLFFVFDRFRFPLVVPLIPFAAAGLVGLRAWWADAGRARVGVLVAVTLGAVLANWPLISRSEFEAGSLVHMGNLMAKQGEYREAIEKLEAALAMNPNLYGARIALGNAFINIGQPDKAEPHLERAVAARPDDPEARAQLGLVHLVAGDQRAAVRALREALDLDPDRPGDLNNLAWVLATSPDDSLRDGDEAVALAERARDLTSGQNGGYLDTLAAAYAEVGRFDAAIEAASRAVELVRAEGDGEKARRIEARLVGYREGRSYRD